MIAGLTYYQIAMYFVIYSFVGWGIEVIFCTVTSGKVVNRGFLNGPVCPIYGFGMLAVLMILKSFVPVSAEKMDSFVLFVGCAILATIVELIGGFLMLKLFHARWWDYSDKPFNFHGFICPEFSILWGIGGVIVIKLAQPLIEGISVNAIPEKYGWPVLAILYVVYLVDLIVTIITVNGLNRDLAEINKVGKAIEKVSNAISEQLGTTAIMTDRVITQGRIQYTLGKAEAKDAIASSKAKAREELIKRNEYLRNDILKKTHFGGGRLLKAFPDMQHTDYRELLKELQSKLKNK